MESVFQETEKARSCWSNSLSASAAHTYGDKPAPDGRTRLSTLRTGYSAHTELFRKMEDRSLPMSRRLHRLRRAENENHFVRFQRVLTSTFAPHRAKRRCRECLFE